ncbi:MAG: AraC family transcriptional regulator [Chitinophagaceae bacterium]|nr:AraC family transcriptional regulator [Chitinophagaceae bacterium]
MKARYKPISTVESNLFKATMQENNKEFDYPWHYHPEFELTYILSSHGVRYVGNSIENFFNNDLVLLGSNLPHCWINSADQHQPASAIVIYLKEDALDKTWMQSCEFESIRKLLVLSQKGIKFDHAVALRIKDRLFDMLNQPPLKKLVFLLEILQDLAETNQYHFLCEQGFSYDLNYTHNERLNIVYKYIQHSYHKKISLSDIAAEVNMSEEYFSRFFSKIMKKSFFEFLNEYKINRACKLLIETDKQVSEVCYASGFESIPFFYRQFKKFKNCQPKTYRLNYQKISS